MDIFNILKIMPIRSEPDVWVSRLVVFERITANPVVVRDVTLNRGLNIIWAAEPEDDAPAARITGHSAGKTTFCRLLRYVLGEKTFGTKAATDLIRKAFPQGYVAAEINISGRRWAVRRPFGSGRMSFISEGASIEDLIEQHGRSVTQDSYTQELGLESLLDALETGGIVQTGEQIYWAHILAWCSRDQEARFQNIHDWRSPRSESDTPSFRFPKVGPLFVMRTVLGLFLQDELKGEERLAELQREKDRLIKEIEEKRREPQFRVNLYDHQLRQTLKLFFPDESDVDSRPFRSNEMFPEDLERLSIRAQQHIKNSIDENERECKSLQTKIDHLGAELRQQERELEKLDYLFGLGTAGGRELDTGMSKREEQRKKFNELKYEKCPLGDVIFNECSYIQGRQHILQIHELQDANAMELAEARRVAECKKIQDEKYLLNKGVTQTREERQNYLKEREALVTRVYDERDSLRNIDSVRDQLVFWMKKRDQIGSYDELDQVRRKLDNVESEIIKIENELSMLLRQHDENRALVASIFSGAVRTVLSSDGYNGRVDLENRELAFRITHGPAMSGEAVETLSVLLADLACLVYNTVCESARLPGFLIHDSPREADLGLRIYRNFIRFTASLQEHFGDSSTCPFQYIITTTTAPPEELQTEKHVKLQLNAATPDGLLLCRDIASENKQNSFQWKKEIGTD